MSASRVLLCLLALGSFLSSGCHGPAPSESPTPTSAVAEAPTQTDGWATYFSPDGGFSAQFPKKPDEVGKGPDSLVLACGLDKVGSNLALMRTALPPGFTLAQLQKNAAGQFGPSAKINSARQTEWQGRSCIDIDASVPIGQLWMRLIPEKPYLYQLIALKSAKASQDVTTPVQARFFNAFQFTEASHVR